VRYNKLKSRSADLKCADDENVSAFFSTYIVGRLDGKQTISFWARYGIKDTCGAPLSFYGPGKKARFLTALCWLYVNKGFEDCHVLSEPEMKLGIKAVSGSHFLSSPEPRLA
jgi:hypothetical protein